MTREIAFSLLSIPVLALGLGIWQVAFFREKSALRSLFEMIDLLVLTLLVVLIARSLGHTRQVDLSLAVLNAFILSVPLTSGAGRLRVPVALILGTLFAVALAVVPLSLPAWPLAMGAAMLGVLFVLGARRRPGYATEWQPATGGMLCIFIGLALNDLAVPGVEPAALGRTALGAVIGLAAAVPLAWLARSNRLGIVLAGGLAAWITADILAQRESWLIPALAGLATSALAVLLARAKLDDATGATSAMLGAGSVGAFFMVHAETNSTLWFLVWLISSFVIGFVIALLLQAAIGLRGEEEVGETAAQSG